MEHIFPFLDSIDALLDDINKIRSSELSRNQFAALINEECQRESEHMATRKAEDMDKDDNVNGCCPKKRQRTKHKDRNISAYSVLMKSVKWITGFSLLTVFCFMLVPERTEYTISTILDSISRIKTTKSAPQYNISDTHWTYRLIQLMRLGSTSLQIERKFPITDFDFDACVIPNPFYKQAVEKCSFCKNVKGFEYDNMENIEFSVVIKSNDVTFSLARLQQMLQKNEIMVNQHTVLLDTNVDYVRSVEDLKDNHVLELLENDNGSHIAGTFLSFMSSHILKRELPRPIDFDLIGGKTFRGYLYLDGKNSPSFKLSEPPYHLIFMYIQCTGSRRLVFSPPELCHHRCQSISRVMKPGEIAFFTTAWSVNSEPAMEKSLAIVDVFD